MPGGKGSYPLQTRRIKLRSSNHEARLQACDKSFIEHATRPDGRVSQAWATATAIIREMSYPQYYISKVGLRWATPLPLGRILVLLCYWAMIIYMMAWNAVMKDAFFWERIGYRNAWVTLMQLPMIFLLSMKFNVVGFLIGSSHERLNWLHRWVARTMFVTATVHGFHFWTEWVLADFVEYELKSMPLVRYGLGAWAVLLLNVVVGLVPIRRMVYEVWLVQHILSSIAMLVLLSYHIPANAMYLLWMSIAFLLFDRVARWAMTGWQNTRWRVDGSATKGMRRWGHNITARTVGDSVTILTIKDVQFRWHAGQHIYLRVPRLGFMESHPYTIACAQQNKEGRSCNDIQLVIRAHNGFSKRLYNHASKNPTSTLTGFIVGPFGVATDWDSFETVVLLGASTGASFTIPIMEHIANPNTKTCVRRVEIALVSKRSDEISYYVERARAAAVRARDKGIDVRLHIAITGSTSNDESKDLGVPLMHHHSPMKSDSGSLTSSRPVPAASEEKSALREDGLQSRSSTSGSFSKEAPASDVAREYYSRPDIEALIREPVEQAWGETAVVVCGGKEIVARTRNCVSRLSDERAVHKGTGAQGIFLHVEEYAF